MKAPPMSVSWPTPTIPTIQGLIGSSTAMAELRALLAEVGRSEASVLIGGPSGSGKELAARAVHAASPRAKGPFVAINCGAIPRDLLESELFGHERGAFTGAHSTRVGRFEAAEGGTLFLDEIGDMPLDMQVSLLRVLEERRFERIGSARSQVANVRVVSATHRNLEEAIAANKFREDLYYRLNVFPIAMPSLAQRQSDVPELVEHFAAAFGVERAPRFTYAGMARLSAHEWPGNVRELRNFVERAAIRFAGREMGIAEVDAALHRAPRTVEVSNTVAVPAAANRVANPFAAVDPARVLAAGPFDLRDALGHLERAFIAQALSASQDIVADAARLLGLQRTTLVEKMRRLDLQRAGDKLLAA